MEIPKVYENAAAVIVGTGPSLNFKDVEDARSAGVRVFAVNNAYSVVDADVHVTVNPGWWDYYHSASKELLALVERGAAWCSDYGTSLRYGLNNFGWFDNDDEAGLSGNPNCIHLGHSSGFSALNIAFLMGCTTIGLLGHDMRYPKSYDGRRRIAGGQRHYFGEYPEPLQHWPTMRVDPKTKTLDGLIVCYEAVAAQSAVKIVNLTPGSAISCFPFATTKEFLDELSTGVQPSSAERLFRS